MKPFPASLCVWLGTALTALAQPAAEPATAPTAPRTAPDPSALEAVVSTIRTLSEDPIVRTGMVGFYLASVEHPAEPILKQNAGKSFITASTMKTLTTGAALEILGPDYQFETRLLFIPSTGDVVIEGSGDPSLGRPDWTGLFDTWTQSLTSAGITEIRGRILADESAWEDEPTPGGWSWTDMGNYYAPPLTPLCFRDNAFRLYFKTTGKPGSPAEFYDADPWPQSLEIADRSRIGRPGTGDNVNVSGPPGTRRYILRGTLAADSGKDYIRGALPDPALFCAQAFTDWLNARQIPVHGVATTTRRLAAAGLTSGYSVKTKKLTVATHRSRPLRELLVPINHRSLNLDCECLLRTLGKGSAPAGLDAIRAHLSNKKLPLDGFDQADGSGLSRTNMITPELMARSLASVVSGPHGSDFLDSLPEIGTPGSTLRKIDSTGPAVIHAKSGSIERVKGYTGIIAPADGGARYCFAILINNYDGSYDEAVGPRLDELFEAFSNF